MPSSTSHTISNESLSSLKEEDFNINLIQSLILPSHNSSTECSNGFPDEEDNSLYNGDYAFGGALSSDFTSSELHKLINTKLPEIPTLLEEMKTKIQALKTQVYPVIAKFNNISPDNHEQVLMMLNTKNRLMLGYLSYLSFYIFLKFNGQFTHKHPILTRLLEFRNLLEKLKPIEKKLQYQLNKILENKDDEEGIKPRPNLLVDPTSDKIKVLPNTSGTEAYTHSKLLPVAYTNNHLSLLEKAEQNVERQKNKIRRSELVKSFKSQLEGTPEEFSANTNGNPTKLYGEDELIDLHQFTNTKNKKKFGSMELNTFDELVDYAQQITKHSNTSSNKKLKDNLLSNLTNLRGSASKLSEILLKADKIVHLKKLKNNLNNKSLPLDISSNDNKQTADDFTYGEDESNFEDYSQFKQQREDAKHAKANQLIKRKAKHIPSIDEAITPNKKRATNAVIDDNRGLTRMRKKYEGNSRVHYRLKHQKKMKKLKSTHTQMREEGSKGYQGETTGLSTKLAKSVQLK